MCIRDRKDLVLHVAKIAVEKEAGHLATGLGKTGIPTIPFGSVVRLPCTKHARTHTTGASARYPLRQEKVDLRTLRTLLHISLWALAFNSASGQPDFYAQLADSAEVLTKQVVHYDPTYFLLAYPNGDVPADKGVCTDIVIRAYRKLGIDLQKEVHVDMLSNFKKYPQNWGLSQPDKNIDHRRVPNLMTFFARHGTVKDLLQDPKTYQPGDIVCWNLGGGITHIGIVSSKRSRDRQRHLMVHNIGTGQVLEDCLFSYRIIGHYRYEK